MIFNGLERFFIEKIRVNFKYEKFGIMTTQAELIAVGIVFGGILLFIFRKKIDAWVSTKTISES